MGNAPSHRGLATVAMAKYLFLTKRQVIRLSYNLHHDLAQGQGFISRHQLQNALRRANVMHATDREVLDCLFTMWDVKGEDIISYDGFVAGISLLACPCDSLKDTLLFAMEALDVEEEETISAVQLVCMLQGQFQVILYNY